MARFHSGKGRPTGPEAALIFKSYANTLWLDPPEIFQGESSSVIHNVIFTDITSFSPTTVKGYKGTTDVTSTIFPAGSPSAVANLLSLPAMTALSAGETYVVSIVGSDGTNTIQRFFRARGAKKETGMVRVK
jgi:hypothetical protein